MFQPIVDAWLRDVARTKRPSTLHNYGVTVRQLFAWRPVLRERAITRLDLVEFRDHRAEISIASANRALRALKACLSWAALNELDHPPVQLRRLLLPAGPRREQALTRAERRRVLEAASVDLPAQAILRICEGTGFRLGEVLNLWWGDIDFERGTVSVTVKPAWAPKTPESVRTVKAPRLVVWLEAYRRTLLHRGLRDPVCQQDRTRGTPWNYPRSTRVCARMRAVYRRAGVEGKKGTHSMRHALAGDLVRAGVPIHAAQRMLGHSSPVTTLGVYARARQDDVDLAGEALEEFRSSSAPREAE